jgi:hypothetical protein
MNVYNHKQYGFMILIPLLFSLFLIFTLGVVLYSYKNSGMTFSLLFLGIAFSIILFCISLFYSLTFTITKDGLLILKFGIGLISKKIDLKRTSFCQIVLNPWYYGWGIRKMEKGWLFNVSGSYAVELMTNEGIIYRIGTDEPEKLASAIGGFIKE